MTTIAVKDGIVASDSRLTQGDVVLDDQYDKRRECNGVQFFIAGNVTDDEQVISCYFEGEDVIEDVEGTPCAEFIIADGLDVYYGGIEVHGFWKMKIRTGTPYAIGSGASYALGAMDAGATAKEAVKIASRDVYTGGIIRTHKLKGKK
jgi:ATP-dependent protease HslVU (ClpYQ) peptidase subunit|tara:strand:+ start:14969 stop:15412 length:444 start_codon:yes stop_codon:yes gene_type:complete